MGLAVTSSIMNSVTKTQIDMNPDLSQTDPEVLMPGFRAAAWTNCGSLGIALVIAVVGMRGIGIVGQRASTDEKGVEVELTSPDLARSDSRPKEAGKKRETKDKLGDGEKPEITTVYEV